MQADGANITSRLIDNYLVDQECKRRGIVISKALIDDAVQELVKLIAGQGETLDQGLADHHETLAQLQDEMKESLEREMLLVDKIQPTRMVHCKAILVRFTSPNVQQPKDYPPHTEAECEAILTEIQKQLAAGKSFSDLANQYSEDPFSKDKGGEVGFAFDGAPLDQDLVRAALLVPSGQVSEPVRVSYGYYLIQVVSTSENHPKSEDSSYKDAEDKYRRQQAEYMVPDYLKTLRAKAKIVNYVP